MLKGIFKPEIILPGGYTEAELKSVFIHELMHLKHGDVPLSMLCTLLLCIYWYNPLMWLCLFVVRQDMELLCDFRALGVLQNRKEYALVLLKTALRKNKFIFATTSMQNGEKEISRRIKYIAHFKRPKALWSAIAIMAIVAVGALCLTNPLDNTPKEVKGYNAETLYKHETKYVPEESDIAAEVEKHLQIIMSSPKEDSNPLSYIEHHQNEYHTILKMGDNALNYMLSQFAEGKADGLKAHIMMSLCKDILGDRNNVTEGGYSSPMEWYQKLTPYTAVKLSEFKPQTEDEIEQLVYSAALKKYSSNTSSLDVVAPHIFDTYEKGNTLKIFATVYYSSFNLYGSSLSQGSGGVVPAAIVYTKNSNGTYTFKEYIEAKDGAYFQKSIEEFCAPKADVAKAIMKHYGNYSDLMELMKKNVIECLKQNNLTGISLKNHNGEITPLT
ncbi:MAG: M56 family metallopeptidase [Bacillota bacterium]